MHTKDQQKSLSIMLDMEYLMRGQEMPIYYPLMDSAPISLPDIVSKICMQR